MLRIQVTSPFVYEYENQANSKTKRHYLAAGDYYHLEEEKDKEEIKYILSPNFMFRNYIYVDTETVPQDIAEELNLDYGFYKDNYVPEEEYIPTLIQNNKFVDSGSYINDELTQDPSPTKEPTTNYFDLTTKEVKVEEVVEIKTEEKLGAENTPTLVKEEKLSEEIVDVKINNKEREVRKNELEEMHYSKVKEIAELYNIDYETKKQTIELILDLEFGENAF